MGTQVDVLSVENLGVVLGGRRVLDRVSFTIRPGEFTGLIGANGAGKTTLLRVVLGLQLAAEGSVLVEGRPLKGRGRSIGYVPQRAVLDADLPLRARDLITLGVDGNRFGIRMPSAARDRVVDEMVSAVGAQRFADSRVGTLSGGETQRVLIAHALAARPRLLLLDEPLANLDLRAGLEIVSLLRRISEEQRVAVLISAHELNALLPAMDRVVYLARGRAATGSSDEVIRADVLSGLYGHKVDVVRARGRIVVLAGDHGGEHHEVEPAAASSLWGG
jgi:zinc/manganese transport system ATP-binding protein